MDTDLFDILFEILLTVNMVRMSSSSAGWWILSITIDIDCPSGMSYLMLMGN